jgi:hypothetical protein
MAFNPSSSRFRATRDRFEGRWLRSYGAGADFSRAADRGIDFCAIYVAGGRRAPAED